MKKMLVFDGDKHISITGQEIDDLHPDKLVELFKSTAAISELVRDISHWIKQGTVTGVCGHSVDQSYADELFDGFINLRMQLDIVFGDDSAQEISTITFANLKK